MDIFAQELPPIGTNAFFLLNKEAKCALVIDAPAEAFTWASQLAEAHDCSIEGLVLTHGHWDHILDAHQFAAAGIPTYGHIADKVLFEAPEKMATFTIPGTPLVPVAVTHWLDDAKELSIGAFNFEIRHVPGHCPGNILLYSASETAAFVGDVIFAGSVGRYDLPGGDFKTLEQSIQSQVYTLPGATMLYPGHGPTTTVEQEIATNPFVRPN